MYCPKCNAKNMDEASFCEECGMLLTSPQAEVPGESLSQENADQTPLFAPVTYGHGQYNNNSMPYQNPGYPAGFDPHNIEDKPFKTWAAVLGLIFGLCSMPSCVGGVVSDGMAIIALLLAVSGIVLSSIGMTGTKRNMAIAGLACSIVGLIMAFLLLSVMQGDFLLDQ